jgi:nucleoside-diphosphate-sugar epimerase
MKNILICGATGFIGRNLLEFYNKKDYNITATYFKTESVTLEYPNVKWVKCDLRNPDDVKSVMDGIDIVLQFAATTSGANDIVNRPYIHVTDNAVMNSLILRECYEQNVEHIIFPSCTVMYQPADYAQKESDWNAQDEIFPTYFGVGNTKVYIEKMCEFFSRLGRTKHTVLRHSNMYGPHDKYDLEKSHVFGATITKVMTNKDGVLNVWGTGEGGRDLLHVDDLVNFVDLSINKQESNYELFNVGLGKATKIIDLIKKIIKHSGKELKIEHDLSKPTIPTSLFLDCSKAKKLLGWEPSVDIDDGIIKTIDWYKNNLI